MEIVDVRECWDKLSVQINRMHRKSHSVEWRPEDIYMACALGHAKVILEECGSFVITYVRKRSYRKGDELIIWFAYVAPDSAITEAEYEEIILDIARGAECSRIVMSSPRKGFMRKSFWTEESVKYYKDVSDGST